MHVHMHTQREESDFSCMEEMRKPTRSIFLPYNESLGFYRLSIILEKYSLWFLDFRKEVVMAPSILSTMSRNLHWKGS